MSIEVRPLTMDRWRDFDRLFSGGPWVGGCWCMWWRVSSRKQFEGSSKEFGPRMKRAMKTIVERGPAPGVLAYVDGEVAAWCSVAPREDLAALERSRTYARIDDRPVWSVVCFYAAKPFRGRGLMATVLRAASEWARDQGAQIVEGYPTEPGKRVPQAELYMGTVGAFRAAGFREVARTANGKPIMRRRFRS